MVHCVHTHVLQILLKHKTLALNKKRHTKVSLIMESKEAEEINQKVRKQERERER